MQNLDKIHKFAEVLLTAPHLGNDASRVFLSRDKLVKKEGFDPEDIIFSIDELRSRGINIVLKRKSLADISPTKGLGRYFDFWKRIKTIFIFQIDREKLGAFIAPHNTVDKPRLEFDNNKGILYINEFEIRIKKQYVISNQQRLLDYIFKQEKLDQELYYSDMPEDILGKPYDDNPSPYRLIAQEVNSKVMKSTNNQIKEFLIANSSKRGYIKINSLYLPKI